MSGEVARQMLWGFRRLAVCRRGALTTSVGSGRREWRAWSVDAIGRTGVAQRRLIDESVAPGVATASMVMAGREFGEAEAQWNAAANRFWS